MYLNFAAAGLYYLAELVEEYTAITKKCIWWMNTVWTITFIDLVCLSYYTNVLGYTCSLHLLMAI